MTPSGRRAWLAPEVVQTSSMDCGPAALKCLLDGFGRPASYGRLREACQTSVDGTSIDTLETVARQLGLNAEQLMWPADHVALGRHGAAPALVVLQQPEVGTHFVVVWRRVGRRVQLMDPAGGRRWADVDELRSQLHRHRTEVDAAQWRQWAGSTEHTDALLERCAALGLRRRAADGLMRAALDDPGWYGLAALDAALRAVRQLVDAGAIGRGAQAQRLLRHLLDRLAADPAAACTLVADELWSVRPLAAGQLQLRGAVLLRVNGRLRAEDAEATGVSPPSAELASVLTERQPSLTATLWWLLRHDGRVAPLALALAVLLASAGVALELLLFRGLFDLSATLGGTGQRGAAALALLALLGVLLLLELPVAREALRLGRHLDLRLRAALLQRLPRLHDRYFQSRPISDMADRSHGIQVARAVPQTVVSLLQALCDLALTVGALVWVAPGSAGWALGMAAAALGVPLIGLPLLAERDLRVRTQSAALAGFHLDALLGAVPIRAHRAGRAVQREHEALLVPWTRSLQGWIRGSLALDGVQGLLCIGLAAGLVFSHLRQQGGVGGADLLLVFWALKLPALGHRLVGLAQALPAQRNALRRLMEPLTAPEASTATTATTATTTASSTSATATPPAAAATGGVAVHLRGASVQAGGHDILRQLDLRIAAGEHVAVVGASGAGKSSLVGVLLGWHRLAAGSLHVDGRPAGAAEVEALRPQVAWVDPAVQLWNRSLLDNLLYASDDAALAQVGAVVDRARLREVAAKLPQGLQTLLGEGGGRLSGGEGQRVRLARALLQPDPRLVLLDEPFRGLDRAQRQQLLAEARQWWHGRTLLCVTHDMGETLAFDRVLVIDDGRLCEDGRPADLAARPSRYRDLLQAERELRQQAWSSHTWRRLLMRDGVLHEARASTAAQPATPAAAPAVAEVRPLLRPLPGGAAVTVGRPAASPLQAVGGDR